jgi:acetyl esterase/lipase
MPGRDWQTEFYARLLKRFFATANRKKPQWSRRVLETATSKTSAMQRITSEQVELGGVKALKMTPQVVDPNVPRIIVFMHGGGYVTGSAKAYLAFVARLVDQSHLLTYSLDYRLSPEHPFPKPQQDCCAAIAQIVKLHPDHQLVLMGDSAGGGLSISTALHGSDEVRSAIASLALISPWVDPMASTGTMVSNVPNDMFTLELLADSYKAHMQGADPMDTRVNFVQADLNNLPPMLIQVAGGEVFLDQVKAFAERAKRAGRSVTTEVFDEQFHVFQTVLHHIDDSKRARASLVAFARGDK